MEHIIGPPVLLVCDPLSLYKENYSPAFEHKSTERYPFKTKQHEQVINSCRKFLKGQTQSRGSIALHTVRT